MNRFLIALSIGFLAISCTHSEIPKDILPQKKMQAVLWDVMLADETANYYVQNDSSVHTLSRHIDLYQQVLQVHQISKDDFKKSLRFYEAHPNLLRPIIDSLQKKSEKITVGKRPVS